VGVVVAIIVVVGVGIAVALVMRKNKNDPDSSTYVAPPIRMSNFVSNSGLDGTMERSVSGTLGVGSTLTTSAFDAGASKKSKKGSKKKASAAPVNDYTGYKGNSEGNSEYAAVPEDDEYGIVPEDNEGLYEDPEQSAYIDPPSHTVDAGYVTVSAEAEDTYAEADDTYADGADFRQATLQKGATLPSYEYGGEAPEDAYMAPTPLGTLQAGATMATYVEPTAGHGGTIRRASKNGDEDEDEEEEAFGFD